VYTKKKWCEESVQRNATDAVANLPDAR